MSTTGIAFFVFGVGWVYFKQRRESILRALSSLVRFGSGPAISSVVHHSHYSVQECCAKLESIVQRDEGRRGIAELVLPRGELLAAAEAMYSSENVAIISGFPCMLQHEPPTETDGPLGCMAIARTLLALGKRVIVMTDECNEEVFLACGAASGLHAAMQSEHLRFESFPGGASFQESDSKRLQAIGASLDLLVAIERTGPASDGLYHTMRGYDMSAIVAPLDDLLQPPLPEFSEDGYSDRGSERSDGPNPPLPDRLRPTAPCCLSIGIGDGGNEVGMGKIYERVSTSAIPNAALIACVVPTTHLIVASVSNWGGYALAAATAVVASNRQGCPVGPLLERCLPSEQAERAMCARIVEAGARDGVTGQLACMVDGMPLDTSIAILNELRVAASEAVSDLQR